MYRVGLIQNQSEMLRYGWADMRPLLVDSPYQWQQYQPETIGDLFADLKARRLDALVVATNALTEEGTLKGFAGEENIRVLGEFINAGGGIFISFQARLPESRFGILPPDYRVDLVIRQETGLDGTVTIPPVYNSHVLYVTPSPVIGADITARCLHNEFVASLYRGYLRSINAGIYDEILVDTSYHDGVRTLLACSKPHLQGRVVISALPLDWQGHKSLLDNVIRFVVEGQPYVAVIEKPDGHTSFDFRYLLANLDVHRIPYRRYTQKELDFTQVSSSLHDTVILDPAWTYRDVWHTKYSFSRAPHAPRLVFFDRTGTGDNVLGTVGGVDSREFLLLSVEIWLNSKYANGRWAGSFWKTFDVVESLSLLGLSFEDRADEILASFDADLVDGSYAEVMGATCALLKLYTLLGAGKQHRFKLALDWVRNRYQSASFFEQVSAADALNVVESPLDPVELRRLRDEILRQMPTLDNDLRLFQFAKTLFSSGFGDDALKVCERLGRLQDSSGAWSNVALTASIVSLLINTLSSMPYTPTAADLMIFRGVTFLKSRYDSTQGNWGDDIPSSARALRAVIEFERRITFPVDEIVQSLPRFHVATQQFKALELASEQARQLLGANLKLQEEAETARSKNRAATNFAIWVGIIGAPLLSLGLWLLVFAGQQGQLAAFEAYFLKFLDSEVAAVSATIAAVPLIMLYILLRAFDRLPKLSIIPEGIEEVILRRVKRDQRDKDAQESLRRPH